MMKKKALIVGSCLSGLIFKNLKDVLSLGIFNHLRTDYILNALKGQVLLCPLDS